MRSDSETLQESPAVVSSAPHELPLPRFNEEFFNVSTPGSVPLNGSTFANRARIVLQTVDKQHGRFAIDFRRDSGEIALHFNPRFSIYLNGQFLYQYRQRHIPFEQVSSVRVIGDADIHSVNIA
ncbi:galactoside-binding lectin [Ancylostoma ceylanicum]|uniref:Galactoside-binding lectin n=1 Tax=Ancylostoma ceylanicum TaxID=53326 RepID=A0A0D6LHA2_9BILA|nr:galactoside-binding lectin [Ancylostoma ceylanicum]